MTTLRYLSGILSVILAITCITSSRANAESVNIQYQKPSSAQNINKSDSLDELITDIKYQLVSAQQEIAKLQEDNFNLKRVLNEKEGQIKASGLKLSELLRANESQMAIILGSKENEISRLKTIAANYEQKIQDLSGHLTYVNDELAKTKENNLTYTKNYQQLTSRQDELQADYLHLQSKAALLEQELQKQKNSSEKTAENNTNNHDAVYLKAVEYLKKDKLSAAMYYSSLAKAYQDSKDYQKAIENYNLAISVNPEFVSAYRELGIIFAESGKYADSVAVLNKYLKYSNNIKEQEVIRSFISKIEKTNQG